VLAWIKVPKAGNAAGRPALRYRVYKISKRFEDDISAVCLALHVQLLNGQVTQASIGVGGVAATPVRAARPRQPCASKPGMPPPCRTRHGHVLRAEFTPLSDLRASATYRTEVLGNLLQRFWLESQGQPPILRTLTPTSATAPTGAEV
jgi:xanthine dehydrogenase small subunit